jgi:paraquat-inducible protein A
MLDRGDLMLFKACHTCGQIHEVPDVGPDERALCVRCGVVVHEPARAGRSSARTAAAALGAFLLFWPAVLMPVVHVEGMGRQYDASLLNSSVHMLVKGDWAVGIVLVLFVLVIPLVKLALLVELSALQLFSREHKTLVYRAMEFAGKWSMIDVFAIALLLMLVKLGNFLEFRFGPAAVALVLYVLMSMVATWSFDPHSVWEDRQ